MNIKDLPQGSYTPVQATTTKKLNIKDLPTGSYSPVVPQTPTPEQPSFMQRTGDVLNTIFGGGKIGEAIGAGIAKANVPLSQVDYSKLSPRAIEKLKATGVPTTAEAQQKEIQAGITAPTGKEVLGSALQSASLFTPVGRIAGVATNVASKVLPKAAELIGASTASAGAGYGYDVGSKLSEGKTVGESLQPGGATALGALIPPVISAGAKAVSATQKAIFPTASQLTSKLDNNISDIFKGTTSDVQTIRNDSFNAKKGLELLSKESPSIKIPDSNAPLGSNVTKSLNLKTATPNEWLSGVLEMGKKIATVGKQGAEKATQLGRTVDTASELQTLQNAIDTGTLGAAKIIKKQIESLGNSPIKIHDWIEGVNSNFYTKGGKLADTATAKLANDTARSLRAKLDTIVDRKGYAEAYGNNQALKKMLVAVAKKANKGVSFGDISTDAGIDAGIALLTGNPAYMARTLGTGLFKGVFSNMRNQSGFRSLKKASQLVGKVPSKAKMPSSRVKNQSLNTNKPIIPQSAAPISKTGKISDIKQSMPNVVQKSAKYVISKTLPQTPQKINSKGDIQPVKWTKEMSASLRGNKKLPPKPTKLK